MEISLQIALPIIANLIAIGVAYGMVRSRLDASEKSDKELREEILLCRERLHDLGNRMSALVLEIVRLRGGSR